MFNLNEIRELVIKQDKELEELLLSYIKQYNNEETNNLDNIYYDIFDLKKSIENYIKNKDFDKALELTEKYKSINGIDIDYYSMLGTIYLYQNKLESALDNFLKVLEIDDYHIDTIYNMGYMNLLLGNEEEALYFYERCINITENEELIKELEETIKLLKKKVIKYTFVQIGNDEEDSVFNYIDNKENLIKIIEKKDLDTPNIYIEDNIKVYEINKKQNKEILEYILRKYKNVVFIFSSYTKLSLLIPFKERAKLVYYKNENYYTTENDFLNRNINLFLEKECFRDIHFAITNNILVYLYKRYVENRNDIFLIDNNILIDNILYNHYNILDLDKTKLSEYEKDLFELSLLEDKNILYSVKDMYYKYKTKELYDIYSSLLLNENKYEDLVKLSIESKFIKEVYTLEFLYVYSIKEFELLKFVHYISIGNFALADVDIDNYLDYRIAVINFEITKHKDSYKKYLEIIEKDLFLLSSPMTNRNISYLMYLHQNNDYIKYYKNYKDYLLNNE